MKSNDRALGAFYGLALGDALGMPTQSFSRAQIIARFGQITGLVDAPADQPIAPNMPKGSITDDTEQAILVAQLLVDGNGDIDPNTLAQRLIAWEAVMQAKGSQDLLGPSTKRAAAMAPPMAQRCALPRSASPLTSASPTCSSRRWYKPARSLTTPALGSPAQLPWLR